MRIGIDGSRAFLKNRTGIEEYSYQVIKNLRNEPDSFEVFLYVRKNQQIDFELPKNWQVKVISWHLFWTQCGLSLEMLFHPIDALFIPAHTVPLIHPARTIVTIHGLEYEFCGQAYSFWEKLYMKASIRKSCKWASRIISVSQNTKKDLMRLYKVTEEKIEVVYEGYDAEPKTRSLERETQILEPETRSPKPETQNAKRETQNQNEGYGLGATGYGKYLLFLGRIEERKNVENIIKAFEILKEKYEIPHKLVLAGKPGFGYENLKSAIQNLKSKKDLVELGFVAEEEKWQLLKNAEVFVFPTQYEGFGIPILEAQSVGCPVVASNNSSIVEVADGSALLVNPQSPAEIAEAIYKIISDQPFKKDLIEKGLENVQRFSWEKCAREVAEILNK